jgi:tripartite-type tricarboxylate transporter receptor subunit TctC
MLQFAISRCARLVLEPPPRPVANIMRGPLVMVVNPSVPANTVPEFIAYAKAHPGKINMASGGNGSSPHVAGELFKMNPAPPSPGGVLT